MTETTHTQDHASKSVSQTAAPTFDQVERAIRRRSLCMLATTSPAGRPHVAAVLYAYAEDTLYVSTHRASRKARNLAANPAAFACVPVRRLPVGPPSSVQFSADVAILDNDDPEVRRLAAGGLLKKITGHGELELPGGCFLRITPGPVRHTYGIGMPLHQLLRDPLNAAGLVHRPPRQP